MPDLFFYKVIENKLENDEEDEDETPEG